jgi:hypothetical protein
MVEVFRQIMWVNILMKVRCLEYKENIFSREALNSSIFFNPAVPRFIRELQSSGKQRQKWCVLPAVNVISSYFC